jgi:hypothetical protein
MKSVKIRHENEYIQYQSAKSNKRQNIQPDMTFSMKIQFELDIEQKRVGMIIICSFSFSPILKISLTFKTHRFNLQNNH